MKVSFMVTNGGPHPADKWADLTTETILDYIQIAEDSVTPEATAARAAKRDLRPKLFAIFNDHHDGVQKKEQAANAKVKKVDHAQARVEELHDPSPHLPSVFDQVQQTLAATPFAAHFAKPEVWQVIITAIGQHTVDVMNIERRWHKDRLEAAKGA